MIQHASPSDTHHALVLPSLHPLTVCVIPNLTPDVEVFAAVRAASHQCPAAILRPHDRRDTGTFHCVYPTELPFTAIHNNRSPLDPLLHIPSLCRYTGAPHSLNRTQD